MPETPENLTLKLLQEMRIDLREFRAEVKDQFAEVNARIDGVTHVVMLLAGSIHSHEERIEKLEAK